MKIRVGIAGYGIVGKRRHDYLNLNPRFEVVSVCDQKFQEEGRLQCGARHYTSYQSMIEKEPLDALFVCLTNDVAPDATILGLQAGCHVFCEKPPGRTVEDITSVIKVSNQHPSQKLKYGFNHRYHDSIMRAMEIISTHDLGEVINLRGVYGKSKILNYKSNWRTQRSIAGGGILLDQGIHMVDLFRLFAGEFSEVHSFISNRYWNHDVEDNAYAIMKTNNGIIGMLNSSATQWRHRFNLEISLSEGAVILSGILSGSKSYGAETITIVRKNDDDMGDPLEETIRYNKDLSWKREIDEFQDCIDFDKPILNGSAFEAMQTMKLVYRIYCSDPKWKNQYKLNEETIGESL
ncbi:Gfo/Idh/MocA family protein [Pseudobacteriovorax antillogorgiicola]|uniref:Predicted dehydrogenase n=1 Tax=Pseudobacteriovorax antillogorgiicola TaxID=1513793 RepID=A0A1Y6CLU8_9BACT|nr:Gfo/Idh/MocA family oxidoreductase [Pseudobacteriovorax antillogorgiicola]TCS45213.1 putative dehydrogenase [Pseudobacteriovorax antillogorgiicola]SMF75474.1 Predicted dehydrogenase [Pseudobacteriovorax antillogorgiicola]